MTLVAIAATAMTLRLQLDIYKTNLAVNNDKYYLASQLVVFWGMQEIHQSHTTLNHLLNNNAVANFPTSQRNNYPPFIVSGEIYDLQGRFNINNLNSQPGRKQFRKILALLNPGLEDKSIQSISRAAWYWQNSYRAGRGQDTLMQAFLKSTPPTLPSHLPFSSISELRLIPGVNATIMRRIWPYITALPSNTALNINTALEPVLKTLGSGMKDKDIRMIMEERKEKPIKSIGKLNAYFVKNNIKSDSLVTSSVYYLIVARVEGEDKTFVNYSLISLLKDKKNSKKNHVKLMRESLNSL